MTAEAAIVLRCSNSGYMLLSIAQKPHLTDVKQPLRDRTVLACSCHDMCWLVHSLTQPAAATSATLPGNTCSPLPLPLPLPAGWLAVAVGAHVIAWVYCVPASAGLPGWMCSLK